MKASGFGLCLGAALFVSSAMPCEAQTTVSLPYPFSGGSDGAQPNSLIQAQDGNYYGTTAYGGTSCAINPGSTSQGIPTGCGTIFRLSPNANGTFTLTTLYQFSGGSDGGVPTGIIQGPDGNLYGTTIFGGKSITANRACLDEDPEDPSSEFNNLNTGCGTIFELSPSSSLASGKLVPIYNFMGGNDGAYPNPLTMGAGGVFYGSTLVCSTCKGSGTSPSVGTLFSFPLPQNGAVSSANIPFFTFTSQNSSFAYPNALVEVAVPLNAQPSAQTNLLYGTAQLGGDQGNLSTGDNGCLYTGSSAFGCGGVFSYNLSTSSTTKEHDLCIFGENAKPSSSSTDSNTVAPRDTGSSSASPRVIMGQDTGRFPAGGNPWAFNSAPMTIAIGSDENIYGTVPPACITNTSTNGAVYAAQTSCTSSRYSSQNIQDIVYQCIPPSPTATSAGTLNPIYQFTGTNDGGGSLQGLILASDGNFYGTSGNVVFDLTPKQIAAPVTTLPQFTSTASGYSPNSMVQGSNGYFFATTAVGGTKSFGVVFDVSTSLAPPVQLNFSSSSITANSSVTLNWTVPNAFTLTSQQCYAFVEGTNASTAGKWSGLQTGSISGSNYIGSTTITPTAAGNYTYALTCGGIVTGTAALVVLPAPPVTVSPSPSSITATQSLTVKVTVAGTPTPTGTVTVSGGSYTSAATTLTSGSATITIPANTLPAGSYTFTAAYVPDSASSSTYGNSSGTASSAVTVSVATPSVTVTPGASSIGTSQVLNVAVGVSGGSGNPTPTGSVTLSGGSYTSSTTTLSSGSATVTIPAGTLAASSYTFKATYTPDTSSSSTYGSASGTASSAVNVTTPTYSMSATGASVAPGGSASSTITVNSSNGYSGTVTLTCSVTAQPSGATDLPTCSGGQLTMNSTTASTTATVTLNTTSASVKLERPNPRRGTGWTEGGAVLALIVFLWMPRRSRRLFATLGILIGCILIANLTACGGGGSSNNSNQTRDPGTTVGNYTITINGAGNDSAKTAASTSFTLTVT